MPKRRIQVEWFNVTYRSVTWASFVVLFLLMAGGGGWYYVTRYAPMSGARSAILIAQARYAEVRGLQGDERLREVLQNANRYLEEARVGFEATHYRDAQVAAARSEKLSFQAIQLVGGPDGEDHQVSVFRIEGDVRVKQKGKFSWRPAEPGMRLEVGDQVKTSSSASAQLSYFDGTSTTIQPGSLLEIRDLYEDPVTKVRRVKEKLTWGEVRASTQKRNVDGSYHEVATEKLAARAEDVGEFRVVYDKEAKTTEVAVFDGRLQVAALGSRETVDAGEMIEARASGQLGPKQALPGVPRLLTPSDQRVFIHENPGEQQISLQWDEVPGSAAYRLVIANAPLFTAPLYDSRRAGTSAVIENVAAGGYYWQVAAISKEGAEGPFSKSRRFRVSSQRIRDRTDGEPPRLEIAEFVLVGSMVIINGETEPGAMLWVDNEKVEVYDDGMFSTVVKLRKEGRNTLSLVAQDTAGNEITVTRAAYVNDY